MVVQVGIEEQRVVEREGWDRVGGYEGEQEDARGRGAERNRILGQEFEIPYPGRSRVILSQGICSSSSETNDKR